MALVGVQECAAALGRSKGTISKHAAAGKIPVADRDAAGHPLFDVAHVRAAYENSINPLMRRRGGEVSTAGGLDEGTSDDLVGEDPSAPADRRTTVPERAPTGLLKQQVLERTLRNQRLVLQLATDQSVVILKAVADNEAMTLARQTRDGVAAQMADFAGKLYAFAAQPHTEGEFRVWLSEHTGAAFDEVEKGLAAEKGDEFGDGTEPTGQPVEVDAAAAA